MPVADLLPRLLPVPTSEPPYDDGEPPVPGCGPVPVQGTLALAFVLPGGLPAVPTPPQGLRLVTHAAAQDGADELDFGVQPTSRAELPDPRPWAAAFAQAVVEAVAGHRPVSQLVRWTTAEVYEEVRSTVHLPPRRTRPSVAVDRSPSRAVVRSVHVSEPADGVAEVAALVRRGLRSTALALRLEGLDGRWRCTALQLG